MEEHFLNSSPESQLMQCIQVTNCGKKHMPFTIAVLQLVQDVFKDPNTFVLRFEDIIGENAGGHLSDTRRYELLQDMCSFLGYHRSLNEVKAACEKVWGNSLTYNPVQKKVGRWKHTFKAEHLKAFELFGWDTINHALGYPTIHNQIESQQIA